MPQEENKMRFRKIKWPARILEFWEILGKLSLPWPPSSTAVFQCIFPHYDRFQDLGLISQLDSPIILYQTPLGRRQGGDNNDDDDDDN